MKRVSSKKKPFAVICILLLALFLISACNESNRQFAYKDGTYIGKSREDDTGAYGEVTIIITSGQISSCKFVTWQADGSIKDMEYGKVNGEVSNKDYYNKAQLAVDAMEKYAKQYEQTKKTKNVDVIAGATIAYDQFLEAVNSALKDAVQTSVK
ncbi:MAG: FMN-binding protein [Fusobacteriaceae bacterium]|jgi:major membrane immunogen (membrane-anchored lipoprotein)|nr:FMN-binding protein [Fusobacteriaceae bacterium]